MKINHTLLVVLCVLLSSGLMGQYASGIIDINLVHALFQSNGRLGDPNTMQPGYHVPAEPGNSGPSPLYASAMWIGGLDSSGILRLAARRFDPMELDLSPGPLGTDASISPTTSNHFNQVWKVDHSDITMQMAYFNCLYDPDCDAQAEFPGYTVPASFFNWPAHGDMSLGQAYDLAPYIDFDSNGEYGPENGDAPCISGDQALFSIYNDMLPLDTVSSDQIGLEVHMMPFAFTSDLQAIDQTLFIRYRLINRGPHTLHDTYLGFWNDYDLGGANDDYVGCDVGRNMFYVYNGDSIDEPANGNPGYGLYPPAFGHVILQGPLMDADGMDNTDTLSLPGYNGTGFHDGEVDNERSGMSHFLQWVNSSNSLIGDPFAPQDYYHYLKGQWKDGTPLSYGGFGYSSDSSAVPASFMFPYDSDSLGVGTNGQVMPPWTEATGGNAPGDRRGVFSTGPFTFAPGQEEMIVVAYVYARAMSGDLYGSVHALQQRTDSIRAFAETTPGILGTTTLCAGLTTDISRIEHGQDVMRLFPNPANGQLHMVLPRSATRGTISVFDSRGASVLEQEVTSAEKSIDVARLKPGLYMARVLSGEKVYSQSFVKE